LNRPAVQQGDTDRLNFAALTAAVGVARANLEAQQAQVNPKMPHSALQI
jgi:hypothetical protein